jgi:plastocyanin
MAFPQLFNAGKLNVPASRDRSRPLRATFAVLCLALAWQTTGVAGELRVFVRDMQGNPVADAVIVANPTGKAIAPVGSGQTNIDQIDKEFVPYIKVVPIGTAVYFPNKDNIRHHVYSFSPAKVFELKLYAGMPTAPIVFDKPGVVTLGCNIHDWMVGHIYVVESGYFTKTAVDGTARLASLPSGEYTVRIWHPRLRDTEASTLRQLTVQNIAETRYDIALKRDFRVPRPPATAPATQ